MRWMGLAAGALLCLGACSNVAEVDPNAAAAQCGQYECPVGTAPKELRQVSGGTNITGGIDLTAYAAEGAYSVFGEGSCEYACELIQGCNGETFPIITKDCFTCGTVNASGQAVQGSCNGQPVQTPIINNDGGEPDASGGEPDVSGDATPADAASAD